jgi:uncharacterized membrane protein
MVTQHVTYWLCGLPGGNWVVGITGAMGGLAAPVFVTLAGVGATFTAKRYSECDRMFVIRGFLVMGFGFLLNILTPQWFSPKSWYILHMIGTALALVPFLRRMSNPALLTGMFVVIITTFLIQNGLETPTKLYNRHMVIPSKPGGILRFALAEGFFPIFPWIAFFLAGMLAGRWLLSGQFAHLWQLGSGLFVAMAVLLGIHATGWQAIQTITWIRFFKWEPWFYPALTPITLFLIAASLLLVYGFAILIWSTAMRSSNFLVCLGRSSLTILIVHVVMIRGSAVTFNFWRSLSLPHTVIATSAVLIFFALVSVYWRKINFRYGAEWFLRKYDRGINRRHRQTMQ